MLLTSCFGKGSQYRRYEVYFFFAAILTAITDVFGVLWNVANIMLRKR